MKNAFSSYVLMAILGRWNISSRCQAGSWPHHCFQQQLWSLEAFHRLTMLQKSLLLSGISKINCITRTQHEWLPCGQPLQPTGIYSRLSHQVCHRKLSPPLWCSLSEDDFHFYTQFFSFKEEQIIFLPTGKISSLREGLCCEVVKCLLSHFKACAQHLCHLQQCTSCLLNFYKMCLEL